jgi:AhpD family alkylhydroperoxidase
MPRIDPVAPTGEPSELREVFDRLRRTRGRVPTIYRILAHHPEVLIAHRAYFDAALDSGRLSRALKEKIAFRVAIVCGSSYSIASHRRYALQHGVSEGELQTIEQGDYSKLDERERATLEFADEVAFARSTVSNSTFHLVAQYFDSGEIIEISAVVGVMVLASRLGAIFDLTPDTDEAST